MSDFHSILQEIKETVELKPNRKQVRNPKNIKQDLFVPFSKKELDALNSELLNYDAAYEEPVFQKTTKIMTEKPHKVDELKPSLVSSDNKEVLQVLNDMRVTLEKLENKIDLSNTHNEEVNSIKIDESVQPLEIVKLVIAETGANENAKYLLQTKDGVHEISLLIYYDMSKFISMLQQYKYSMVLDKSIVFENKKFNQYKEKLTIISQNMLANSFRFFEKSNILDDTIILGHILKEESTFIAQAVDEVETVLTHMQEALKLSEYQKDFYFARHLHGMGYILNAITIINEMLGEYIVELSRSLSGYADERIQSYVDKIELSRSTRKAYYRLHSSAKDFFASHFSGKSDKTVTTFFPFKDSGNEEINTQMTKLYTANKGNKSSMFHAYSDLIDRVRWIRNDLAHGNNSRAYQDITGDINEVLIDFEYLAVQKSFLKG